MMNRWAHIGKIMGIVRLELAEGTVFLSLAIARGIDSWMFLVSDEHSPNFMIILRNEKRFQEEKIITFPIFSFNSCVRQAFEEANGELAVTSISPQPLAIMNIEEKQPDSVTFSYLFQPDILV